MRKFNPLRDFKTALLLLVGLSLSFQALAIPFLSGNASAGSLSFAWKDYHTITVSGDSAGDLTNPDSSQKTGKLYFSGSVSGSAKCNSLSVQVDLDANTATLQPKPTESVIGNPGNVYCYDSTYGISGPQTVSGTRPTLGGELPETPEEKDARITLLSPLSPDKSPNSINISLKDSKGKVTTLLATKAPDNVNPYDASEVFTVAYTAHFVLEPGKYELKFSALDKGKYTVTKVKHVVFGQTYGKGYALYNFVDVEIEDTIYAKTGAPVSDGPQQVVLKKDGKVIDTVATNKVTHNPTSEEQNAPGATSQFTLTLSARFKNVKPGTYQVCIKDTDTCGNVKNTGYDPPEPNPVKLIGSTFDPLNLAGEFKCDKGDQKACSESEAVTCESHGGSLSWIFCPLINGLASAVDGIWTKIIQPQLATTPINLTNPNSDPSNIFKIWKEFRIYGDIFLVIALLVIVFGQSIGGGLIDAYTAKKILPRLLISAVLINLSIYIVSGLVDLTNILGKGIGALLTEPFKHADAYHLTLSGGTSGLGIAMLGLFAVVGVALIAVAQFTLLLYLIPVFLLFLAILVVVIVRRALIVLLIVVSPVAFALYCLPNTEKYFKQWWDLLLKTLLIYPIMAVLFALGFIMSATIGASAHGHSGPISSLTQFVAIFAFMVPLGLIPFAFKMAGGIIGGISGAVHGRRGGLSQRLSKQRQEKMGQKKEEAMSGTGRFSGSKVIGAYRRANSIGQGGLSVTSQGRAKYSARKQALFNSAANEALKKDEGRSSGDDTATSIATKRGMTASKYVQEYSDSQLIANTAARKNAIDKGLSVPPELTRGQAQKQARESLAALEGNFGAKIGTNAMRTAAFKARASSVTGYNNAEGDYDKGLQDMFAEAGSLVKDGLITSTDAATAIKANKARADQSGIGFGAMLGTIEQAAARVDTGAPILDAADVKMLRRDAIEGSAPGALVGGRHETIAALSGTMVDTLDTAIASGDQTEIRRQLAEVAGKYDVMAQISPKAAREMAKNVMAKPAGTSGKTVREMIEANREDPEFMNMRRDIGVREAAAGQPPLSGPAAGPQSGPTSLT